MLAIMVSAWLSIFIYVGKPAPPAPTTPASFTLSIIARFSEEIIELVSFGIFDR